LVWKNEKKALANKNLAEAILEIFVLLDLVPFKLFLAWSQSYDFEVQTPAV
jgi:hypothetical protein